LILAADNESEMAGVMAHEIAHVCARHAMRQMTRSNWANIMSLPLIFVGGGVGYAARAATSLLLPATFMKFSRSFEAEADYLGVQYAYKSGYDPQGLIQMFEKTEALEKKKPGTLAKAFDSHPQTPDRVSASEKEIASILPPRESYIVNTSEFDDVKARLAALENKRKVKEAKGDESGPSLRRNTADNTQNTDTQKKDDDRPTLKRRDDQNPDQL
jgi:predicted Zn-dependent protease